MVKFIAEISSNHNMDLKRALKLIEISKIAGFDAVKFQLFKLQDLFSPEALRANPSLRDREKWELPVSFIPILSEFAHSQNLEFSCTPFYLEAVEVLAPHCDFLKIASYELLWHDLAKKCAETELPLILSTGMAELYEIDNAVDNLRSNYSKLDLTLLHAVSSYPAPPSQCNLKAIQEISNRYSIGVGWSDHTVSPGVIHRAVHKFGAVAVELHIDLDGLGYEFESGHCWLPHQASTLISEIREGISADGDGWKRPVNAEIPDREWRADPSDGLRPILNKRSSL